MTKIRANGHWVRIWRTEWGGNSAWTSVGSLKISVWFASFVCFCLYTGPLNNPGLNCTGPVTHRFFAMVKLQHHVICLLLVVSWILRADCSYTTFSSVELSAPLGTSVYSVLFKKGKWSLKRWGDLSGSLILICSPNKAIQVAPWQISSSGFLNITDNVC